MAVVELHQPPRGEARGQQGAPAAVGEHALDEVLPQPRVVEPALLLHRQVGPGGHQRGGVQPPPLAAGRPGMAVHPHPLHPAARRAALEDVAGDLLQLRGHAAPVVAEGGGGIHLRRVPAHRARRGGVPLQAQRGARHAQAHRNLGADRDELEPVAQRVGHEGVALVVAVPAHRLPQQATADAQADGAGGIHPAVGWAHGAHRFGVFRDCPASQ